jgi:hypothetical protein
MGYLNGRIQPPIEICVIRVICGLSTPYPSSGPFTISRSVARPGPGAPLICVYLRSSAVQFFLIRGLSCPRPSPGCASWNQLIAHRIREPIELAGEASKVATGDRP